jgi:hypothetical protein
MNSIIKTEFKKLLLNLPNQRIKEDNLNIFSCKRSAQFNHNLMTVGRYITGAHPDCVFAFRDTEYKTDSLIKSLELHEGAMNWVADFENPRRKVAANERRLNTRHIPFWRVTRQIAFSAQLTTDTCWSDQIAWTNLYKIAKNGRNPSEELLDFQSESAKVILLQEIADAKPKNIIFLTGWNDGAKAFIENNLSNKRDINKNNVCFAATLTINDFSCNIIVAEQVQGTKETELANTITQYIKA